MRRRGRILEELLVAEASAGDRRAFEALVRGFHPRLTRLAVALVGPAAAADVVQEAWLGIYRGIAKLEDPDRFRAWAFQVVANKSRDWIRRRRRERRGIERLGAEPAPTFAPPFEPEEAPAAEAAAVRQALAGLPGDHRVALELFYLEELSVGDVARVLGVAPGTVKSRLFHARRKCRSALERSAQRMQGELR
jgi:RNA polymerase sigma-70 factor (ECF subfamily)